MLNYHYFRKARDIVQLDQLALSSGPTYCPVCGAAGDAVFSVGRFKIVDCPSCEHRFSPDVAGPSHVESVYGDSYFFGGGDGYKDYFLEADLLRAQGRRYGSLLAKYEVPGRILDVGAAAGFIQAGLGDAGWTTTGLEPNGRMARHARDVSNLDVFQGTLENAPDWLPFDAICMIQVIGHFQDLQRALRAAARLTRPGGLCLIEYWRRDSWLARAFGTQWHEYSPPSVLHWFTRDSLDRVLHHNGFSVLAWGKPKKYISGGHARSLLEHKLSGSVFSNQLSHMTTLIPARARLRYPSFDLEWRLYRYVGEEIKRTAVSATTGARH